MMSISTGQESLMRTRLLAISLILAVCGCEQARYNPSGDAVVSFQRAQKAASADGKHLMVVFGADWCPDCRKLHDNLQSAEVQAYMQDHMDYLTVDVGDKDRNLVLAEQLGVSVANGIPVAVFFLPDGRPIGATNDGQLEPSRYLTSRQILRFVQAIVEQRQITRPTVVKDEQA